MIYNSKKFGKITIEKTYMIVDEEGTYIDELSTLKEAKEYIKDTRFTLDNIWVCLSPYFNGNFDDTDIPFVARTTAEALKELKNYYK